jgi:heat shock protein HtpX
MKRIGLFLLTNIAILAVITIVFRLLGIDGYLNEHGGIDFGALLIFSAIIGFTGSFISLAISKKMALMSTGAKVIDQPRSADESWLLATVQRQAQQAGIGMPDVAIFESPEINAFATGASRNKALVAVSSGLMRGMTKDEAEAVVGHEVAHIANGDMVTMTLLQGVLNTFVIFLSRIAGHFIDRVVFRNEGNGPGIGFFVSSLVAQILFGVLASIIVCWFSRRREFRADAGGARLAGRGKMADALRRLQRVNHPGQDLPKEMAAFGIAGFGAHGLKQLFMTHPPLEERIAALESAQAG